MVQPFLTHRQPLGAAAHWKKKKVWLLGPFSSRRGWFWVCALRLVLIYREKVFLFSRASISLPLAKRLKRLNSLLEGGLNTALQLFGFCRVRAPSSPPQTNAGRHICYSAVATKQTTVPNWLPWLFKGKPIFQSAWLDRFKRGRGRKVQPCS